MIWKNAHLPYFSNSISDNLEVRKAVETKIQESKSRLHCKVIIGRNPIEANANTGPIQLPGNPVAYHKVASRSTCYYSENQLRNIVTTKVLFSTSGQ